MVQCSRSGMLVVGMGIPEAGCKPRVFPNDGDIGDAGSYISACVVKN